MVYQMKILLLLVTSSLALPASLESKQEKRSISVSDPANLVDKNAVKGSSEIPDLKTSTNKLQDKSAVSAGTTESKPISFGENFFDLPRDEFKVKVFDFTKPTKEKLNNPEVRIGLPAYGPETHIIRIPEPYIIRVPHIVVIRDPQFIASGDHFGATSSPGSFYPFGEFPGITEAFPSSENLFDISQIYPLNPIEISQGFEGFQPINGASEIQGFPGFGDVSPGIEILQPEQIPTIGINEEKIDHESDSVVIDAVGNVKKEQKPLKAEELVKKENPLEEEQHSKEEKPLREENVYASDKNKNDPTSEPTKKQS